MFLLRQLLKGRDEQACRHLEEFWSRIPSNDPRVCWYPSAGGCFRDLMIWRLFPNLREHEPPDIFIHTDYMPGTPSPDTCVLYEDKHTRIEMIKTSELDVDAGIEYVVRPDFATFAEKAFPQPCARLIDLKVASDRCGESRQTVLYFYFENLNWFEEFVLKRGLQITHLFKVREGCSFGGNRKSVTLVYGFLDLMGCRFLVADQYVRCDWQLFSWYRSKYARRNAGAFRLRKLGPIDNLSGFEVQAFLVKTAPGPSAKPSATCSPSLPARPPWPSRTRGSTRRAWPRTSSTRS